MGGCLQMPTIAEARMQIASRRHARSKQPACQIVNWQTRVSRRSWIRRKEIRDASKLRTDELTLLTLIRFAARRVSNRRQTAKAAVLRFLSTRSKASSPRRKRNRRHSSLASVRRSKFDTDWVDTLSETCRT